MAWATSCKGCRHPGRGVDAGNAVEWSVLTGNDPRRFAGLLPGDIDTHVKYFDIARDIW